MKAYVKPMLDCYSLTVEERFAAGSACEIPGSCEDEIRDLYPVGYF